MIQQAQQKVAVAKAAKDETFDWDAELASASGTAPKVASGEGGPTNAAIDALKKQVAADPKIQICFISWRMNTKEFKTGAEQLLHGLRWQMYYKHGSLLTTV